MDSNILLCTIIIMVLIALASSGAYADRKFWLEYYRKQADDNFDFAMRIIKSSTTVKDEEE